MDKRAVTPEPSPEPDEPTRMLLCTESMPCGKGWKRTKTLSPPPSSMEDEDSPVASPVFDGEWQGPRKEPRECTPMLQDPKVQVKKGAVFKPLTLKDSMVSPPSGLVDILVVKPARACKGPVGAKPCRHHPYKPPGAPKKAGPDQGLVEISVEECLAEIESYKDVNTETFEELRDEIQSIAKMVPSRLAQLTLHDGLEKTKRELAEVLDVFRYRGVEVEQVERFGWTSFLPADDVRLLPVSSRAPLARTFFDDFDKRCEDFEHAYKALHVYRMKYEAYKAKAKPADEFYDDHDLFVYKFGGKVRRPSDDDFMSEFKNPQTGRRDYDLCAKATLDLLESTVRRQNTCLFTPFKPTAVIDGFEMTYPMLENFEAWRSMQGRSNKFIDTKYPELSRAYFLLKSKKAFYEAMLLSMAAVGY